MKPHLPILFLLAAMPHTAQAQLVCTLSATPVRFDTVTAVSVGTLDARGAITVTCAGSKGATIAACVEIGEGAAGAPGQKVLTSSKGNRPLPVQVFQDATLARPWGDAAFNQALMMQRTGDGSMTATVYLRAALQKGNAVPGLYGAQLPLTLRYGVASGPIATCAALSAAAIVAPAPHQNASKR